MRPVEDANTRNSLLRKLVVEYVRQKEGEDLHKDFIHPGESTSPLKERGLPEINKRE